MADTNNTDGRQSLSDLGTVLQQQGEAAQAASDARAEDYLAGKIDEPTQVAPLRAQELDKPAHACPGASGPSYPKSSAASGSGSGA